MKRNIGWDVGIVATLLDEETLTVVEVARLLHVSSSTIWRWISQGRLPAHRVGQRHVRVRKVDLALLVAPARGSVLPGQESGTIPAQDIDSFPMSLSADQDQHAAMTRARALQARILAQRNGDLLPPAWENVNIARDERSDQL